MGVIQRTPSVEALAEVMVGSELVPRREGELWNSGQIYRVLRFCVAAEEPEE